MRQLAGFISYLFHPLLMPSYIFLWLLYTGNYFSFFLPPTVKILLLAITFVFTCLLPVFNLFLLKRFKIISDYYVYEGSKRFFPYVITALFYFGMTYLLWDFKIPVIFKSVIFSAGFAILLSALLNLKWKISAHMVGVGGLLAVVLMASYVLGQNYVWWISFIVLLSGAIGSSRLLLEAHTASQVYAGFFLGLFSCVLSLFFILFFSFHG